MQRTYYARPPHIPSIARKNATHKILALSSSSGSPAPPGGIIPREDSSVKKIRMKACTIAGIGRYFRGRGGNPNEIVDRDRKTVV